MAVCLEPAARSDLAASRRCTALCSGKPWRQSCGPVRRGSCSACSQSAHQGPVVTSLRPPRPAAPPPEPVPVQHSPTYLMKHRELLVETAEQSGLASVRGEEPFAGGAVEWAVRRVDASLDEAEDAPPAAAKALWAVARGPVGSATARGVTAAALVTVKAGTTALKAAAPVGKWALKQGVKAAFGLMTGTQSGANKRRGEQRPSNTD
ncbi:hypothetical protein WJX81_005014 [Elliptochloris bilobata]|uniref:Uncharacterized protein n=1 Tax=Elliptochloris bilobata TaxID=381761 RepID=A0AAW1RTU0_9CHLO